MIDNTTGRKDIFRHLVDHLHTMSAPQHLHAEITEDTEIYMDLGIYGDEIVELVWWLEREFGVDTNIDIFKYAPKEGAFVWMIQLVNKVFGHDVHYESLKVRDIIAAIEARRWPDNAAG